jgi:hypothetical protein
MVEQPIPRQTSVRILVRNRREGNLTLYLEPWGEEIQMPAKSEYLLVGHGPEEGSGFTIECNLDSVVVCGWTGSTVQVFFSGAEVGDTRWRPPVPDFGGS